MTKSYLHLNLVYQKSLFIEHIPYSQTHIFLLTAQQRRSLFSDQKRLVVPVCGKLQTSTTPTFVSPELITNYDTEIK